MTSNYMSRSTPFEQGKVTPGRLFAYGDKSGWVVLRALDTELMYFHYILFPSIPGGNASGPFTAAKIPDTPQRSSTQGSLAILYHEYQDEIWQVAMGISKPLTYVLVDYPTGVRQGMLRNDIGPAGWSSTSVDQWGWKFAGWESFYGKETMASQVMIPQKIYFGMAIYNIASYAITPQVRFPINKIRYEALDPEDKDDAVLINEFLKARIDREMPRWTPGMTEFTYPNGIKSTFGVYPVKMTKRMPIVNKGSSGSFPLLRGGA